MIQAALLSFSTVIGAPSEWAWVEGRVLVRFEPTTAAERPPALPGVETLHRLVPESRRRGAGLSVDGVHHVHIATLRAGIGAPDAARALSQLPGIRYAEPDYIISIDSTIPNDKLFTTQWGLHNAGQSSGIRGADIDAPLAWDLTTGSSETVVAVIDSGLDTGHPDLSANVWCNPGESGGGFENDGIDNDGNGYVDDVHGYDFLFDDPDPCDANGHGTHVAGTIGAVGNNARGVAGVNWNVSLMGLRVLDAEGLGSTSAAARALYYAMDNGARIANLSWGGDKFSQTLLDALDITANHEVLTVAAAGNDGRNTDSVPHYPASYNSAGVIAVASTDSNDVLSATSNFGSASVDIGAPGSDILSTIPAYVSLFAEDFEDTTPPGMGARMQLSGSSNTWGTIDTGDNIVARADWRHTRPYGSGADGSMTTPAVDSSDSRGLLLQFAYRYEIHPSDELTVAVWDGTQWVEVFRRDDPDHWTTGFSTARIDLKPYRNANLQVRFSWRTDDVSNGLYGAEIDDIRIAAIASGVNGYETRSGTSMGSAHATGVAALLLDHEPSLCLPALKQRLISTGDAVPALADVTASGGRLNAHRVLTTHGVVSPNGGENWRFNDSRTITWVSDACAGEVSIELLHEGVVAAQIASAVPNTGSFNWTIPGTLEAGSRYRVRIVDGRSVHESDANFVIRSCHADWNIDGSVSAADLLDYLADYNASQEGMTPVYGDPNLTPGVVNTSDVLAYLNIFTTGC